MNLRELLPLLVRREQLLSVLRDADRNKYELVDSVDISRSTVDRTVRRLEQEGLAERRDGAVGLTLAGRLLYDEYRDFAEAADGVLAAREALAVLPPDTEIHPAALTGADVTIADRTTPYRPADRHLELIAEADHIDLLGTAIAPRFIEAHHDAVIHDGAHLRAAVTPTLAESLATEFPEIISEMLASGRLTLRELSEPMPFSLARFETTDGERISLVIHSSNGPNALIENDTAEAIAFADRLFERYWSDASEIPAPSREA